MDPGHGIRSCGNLSTTPWARQFARATARLALPIQFLPIQFSLYVKTLALFNGVSTVMPSVALLCSEAAVKKQVP
jgi:hypothetical protein